MGVEHLLDQYTFSVDFITAITCVMLLVIIQWALYFSRGSMFSYLKRSVCFILVGSVFNLLFAYVVKNMPDYPVLIMALRSGYHICFMCCLYIYLLYMKRMLDVRGKLTYFFTIFTRVLFVVALVLDILSPLTGFGFHRAGGLWFDPLISPYNAFYAYGVSVLFFMLLLFADRLIRSVRYCLIAAEVLVLLVMTKGAIDNSNSLSSFTYILPVLVMLVLLHSKPFDDKTGALGVDSLSSFIKQAFRKKTPVDYMILQLGLNGSPGLPSELGKVLNSFWHSSFKNALLFRVDEGRFVLAIPRTEKNGDTEKKIRYLLEEVFPKYYAQYQFPFKVVGLFDIDFIQNEIDLFNIAQYFLLTMDDNTAKMADGKTREQLRLLHDIMENLADISQKMDLSDERVLVYCQPIRNMKTGAYDTAEALMRLRIPEKDLVMPYLFIPLAEHYGYIHALTMIMLNKVCMQVRKLEEEGFAFARISVNFSASDIKAEHFCDEILQIIRNNEIAPSKIGIEITETQNEGDFNILREKMDILRENGMTIYLDDVGTGFSNLDRIVRYDVDVVKFDRFFLLEAEKDQKVGHMLRHLAEAFKDLNYSLLYEGVETEENEQLCMKCGADYIQGFKYSRPLPMECMRDFFNRKAW